MPLQDVASHEANLRALCPMYKRDDPRVLLLMPSPDRCRAVRAAIRELQARKAVLHVEGECKPPRTAACVLVKFAESVSVEMISGLANPNWLDTCTTFAQGETPRDFRLLPTMFERPRLADLLSDLKAEGVLGFTETSVCAMCLADETQVDHMVSAGDIAICNTCIAAGRGGRNAVRAPASKPTFRLLVKCDFCRAGLEDVESMMTSDEANICAHCLRNCEAMLDGG